MISDWVGREARNTLTDSAFDYGCDPFLDFVLTTKFFVGK